jgi:hypothetical protein
LTPVNYDGHYKRMDDMNDNTIDNTVPADKPARVRKPAPARNRKPAPAKRPTAVRTFDDVVAFARTVTPATFAADVARVNTNHGVTHAARNVGRFTRGRIMDVQNETLRDNVGRQLDDVQLLFVWRAEFPMASGAVFTADPRRGVEIVRGVRAEYNRAPGHHGAKFPVTVASERYGDARFVWPTADATRTA